MANNKIPFVCRPALQNFPFIEQDFDSLNNYGLLSKVVEYLNKVINSENNLQERQDLLEGKYESLRSYVLSYFEGLDVQDAINHKIDEMINNGSFEIIISKYIAPYFSNINNKIEELDTKVSSLNNIAPTVVSSIESMTDHDKTYVLTTDGNWYYWNGSNWIVGGSYNSDVTEDSIKWWLDHISENNYSSFNPDKAWEGALATSDGQAYTDRSYKETYWCTDYIDISKYTLVGTSRDYLQFTLGKDATKNCYKMCIYDADKNFVQTSTTVRNHLRAETNRGYDLDNWKYVRIQFLKTVIPFEDRYKLLFTVGVTSNNFSTADRYRSVDNNDIASSSITKSKLSGYNYRSTLKNMLENGYMPFDKDDFAYGTITTAEGAYSVNKSRLSTGRFIDIPAGTNIELTNGWSALAFSYNANEEYLGRYVSDWTSSIYFPADTTTKLVFKNEVLGEINSQDAITNLLSNIVITKDSGRFSYEGEKINLINKFGASNTGLTLAGQDSAIAEDGHIITFTSTGYYKVLSIYGQLLKTTTPLDQQSVYAPHSNCASFGTEKFDSDDLYPIVYTNAYNTPGLPKGALYGYRLKNDLTTELKQQIIVGFTDDPIWNGDGENVRPYGNFIVDTDTNSLYAYTMIDSLNVTRFFKFNMPALSAGGTVTLNTSDIVEYFDVPYFYYIQGGCYYNGKIYASCGFTANDCKLYVVDLKDKKVTSTVPLGGFVGEPETVFVYEDELYLSSGTKLFKLKF